LRYKIHEDFTNEIWKLVNTDNPKINERYEISNHGRYRIKESGYIMAPRLVKNYYYASFKINGKPTTVAIHRLVAFAFSDYDIIQDDLDVDHINKDPHDNHIDNLKIMNRKDHGKKDHGKAVLGLSKDAKYIIFQSQTGAEESLGKRVGNISKALARKGCTAGYKWYLLNTEEAQEIMKIHEQDTTINGQFQI
jgi:hypothetical protein